MDPPPLMQVLKSVFYEANLSPRGPPPAPGGKEDVPFALKTYLGCLRLGQALTKSLTLHPH